MAERETQALLPEAAFGYNLTRYWLNYCACLYGVARVLRIEESSYKLRFHFAQFRLHIDTFLDNRRHVTGDLRAARSPRVHQGNLRLRINTNLRTIPLAANRTARCRYKFRERRPIGTNIFASGLFACC